MAIHFEIAKHAVCNPANVLAQNYGEHMFSIQLNGDTDNGSLVAVGDYLSLDLFKEAAVTSFEGKIVQQMTNGNYLVMVTDPGDAVLVYEKPLIAEEYSNNFKKISNFYNKAGEVVRCYGLHKYDRFEVSKEAFSGEPAVGKSISSVSNKKMVIGA